jgi:hypothetical protein
MKDPKNVKRGRANAAKGKRAEKTFRDYLVDDAKKRYGDKLSQRDFIPPVGAERGVDMKLSTAAYKRYPLGIEIKYGADISICKQYYEQAENHAGKDDDGTIPVVFNKRGRSNKPKDHKAWHPPDKQWLATISADLFLDMLEIYVKEGNK